MAKLSGHGWIVPNVSGVKARCGGPGMCGKCFADEVRVLAERYAATLPDKRQYNENDWSEKECAEIEIENFCDWVSGNRRR